MDQAGNLGAKLETLKASGKFPSFSLSIFHQINGQNNTTVFFLKYRFQHYITKVTKTSEVGGLKAVKCVTQVRRLRTIC